MANISFLNTCTSPECNLYKQFISRPATTDIVRVFGHGLDKSGLCQQTLAIVDWSLPLWHGDYVTVYLDRMYLIKKLHIDETGYYLMPIDNSYFPVKISGVNDFCVYGKVTRTINCYEPIDEYLSLDTTIDLNAALIKYPEKTYFAKLSGEGVNHLGIYPGALLLICDTMTYKHGDLVVLYTNNSFMLMQIDIANGHIYI